MSQTRKFKFVRFIASSYYQLKYDSELLDCDELHPTVVKLARSGQELVSQYYFQKYKMNIIFPVDEQEKDLFLEDFLKDNHLQRYLNEVKKKYQNDYRVVFYFGINHYHSKLLIYIHEKGKQLFLYADSLGGDEAYARKIVDQSNIPLHMVKYQCQSDSYSCYSYSLKFGCDAVAINPLNNTYYIPNLISYLELYSQKTKMENFYVAKLPDELLKTVQRSKFLSFHHPKPTEKTIHQYKGISETLEDFRKRYTDKNMTVLDLFGGFQENVDISNYLRKKGLRYADMIEIQFYANQFEKYFKEWFTASIREDFVKRAKSELQVQGSLEFYKTRKGLEEFAKQYLANLREAHKSHSQEEVSKELNLKRKNTNPSTQQFKKRRVQDGHSPVLFSSAKNVNVNLALATSPFVISNKL